QQICYLTYMISSNDQKEQVKRRPHRPHNEATTMRAPVYRPNTFGQTANTYRSFKDLHTDAQLENKGEALTECEVSIQKDMIDHFKTADEDYGRRVKEEMKKKIKEMELQVTKGEIGRKAGHSKYGEGSMDANEATKEAVDKSQEAD